MQEGGMWLKPYNILTFEGCPIILTPRCTVVLKKGRNDWPRQISRQRLLFVLEGGTRCFMKNLDESRSPNQGGGSKRFVDGIIGCKDKNVLM